MSKELVSRLVAFRWPGNVRELRNTIERAVVLAGEGTLGVEHLPPGFGESAMPVREDDGGVHLDVGTTVDEAERQLILKTLEATGGNKTRAADILGVSVKTLQNKVKEYAAGQ